MIKILIFKQVLKIFFLGFIFILFTKPIYADTVKSYLITEGIENSPDFNRSSGYVLFYKIVSFTYTSGKVVLSSNPDGTGNISVGDFLRISMFHAGVAIAPFDYYNQDKCKNYQESIPPADITQLFKKGVINSATVIFSNWCCLSIKKKISRIYLVNTGVIEGAPAAFLDLPWDYAAKGLTFNEAAMSITSYFDHEYPFLSTGMKEPKEFSDSIVSFKSNRSSDKLYSSHDGYDYSRAANVKMGDPVLAAAEGFVSYVNTCKACGNMILIDHQNGYQTRYLHLQDRDLVVNEQGRQVFVKDRQMIGRVGATGNVYPAGDRGSHIHFGLFYDKNHDGNFADNLIDGAIDPYGWQSDLADPWENYNFIYNEKSRSGSKSYYLFKNQLNDANFIAKSDGGVYGKGRYRIQFPKNLLDKDYFFQIQAVPAIVSTIVLNSADISPIIVPTPFPTPSGSTISSSLRSIGSAFSATVKDFFGNAVANFKNTFDIGLSFDGFDLSAYKTNTLSIYSSSDGIIWNKENTTINSTVKMANSQVNHLTYFALMAELKDAAPPITTASITGSLFQENTYNSNVQIVLTAVDNEAGSGVDYTTFNQDESGWQIYNSAVILTADGYHKIEFYSIDKEGNIEETKTVEFDINKTLPVPTLTPAPTLIFSPTPSPALTQAPAPATVLISTPVLTPVISPAAILALSQTPTQTPAPASILASSLTPTPTFIIGLTLTLTPTPKPTLVSFVSLPVSTISSSQESNLNSDDNFYNKNVGIASASASDDQKFKANIFNQERVLGVKKANNKKKGMFLFEAVKGAVLGALFGAIGKLFKT